MRLMLVGDLWVKGVKKRPGRGLVLPVCLAITPCPFPDLPPVSLAVWFHKGRCVARGKVPRLPPPCLSLAHLWSPKSRLRPEFQSDDPPPGPVRQGSPRRRYIP